MDRVSISAVNMLSTYKKLVRSDYPHHGIRKAFEGKTSASKLTALGIASKQLVAQLLRLMWTEADKGRVLPQ